MRAWWMGLSAAVAACTSSSEQSPRTTSSEPTTPAPTASVSGAPTTDVPPTATGASSSGSGPVTPPPGVVVTNESMTLNGASRSYILVKPSAPVAGKSYPLVLVFHGNPGSAAEMHGDSQFESATQTDAVVAYPDGAGGNWDLTTPVADNVDIAFVRALPAEIEMKIAIDRSRVFGNGHSGGAFFLNQMNCRVSGVFKAFVSESGGAPYAMNDESPVDGCFACPAGPIPSLHIHGDADTVVGAGSGPFAAKCWSETDQCASADTSSWPSTTPSPCQRAPGCGAPVELCDIAGMGHDFWPAHATTSWSFFQSL